MSRGLVELATASQEFTNAYMDTIFSRVRFDMNMRKSSEGELFKSFCIASADVAQNKARQLLEQLDDEIVWAYMTHLDVEDNNFE